MKEILKYIKDGIHIDKDRKGYNVFTIPTQHFKIKSLKELTPKRFEKQIKAEEKRRKLEAEMTKRLYDEFELQSEMTKCLYDEDEDDLEYI